MSASNVSGTICNISFSEKVKVFSHEYLKCCLFIANNPVSPLYFTKLLYSRLTSSAQILEDFLDFHGAKNNQDWYYYRELSAAMRHLSLAAYYQKHIANRLVFYELPDTQAFEQEGLETLDFLTKALVKLAPEIVSEATRLKIPLPESRFDAAEFPGVTTSEILGYNIDDKDKDQQKKHIVNIANELLRLAGSFDQMGFYEPYEMDQMKALVPDKVNEVMIRQFEMLIHNLQSSFDTYVIHGGFRFRNQKLRRLRGFISIVFHMLQITGRMLHFYERHLYEAGYKHIYKRVQDRLAARIDPERLLDRIVNFGLFYVCEFLNSSKELGREILNENVERSRIRVSIPVKLGFHSRPSLLVAKIVQHYGGQVDLLVGEDRFDASSVLDIQWAGGKISKEDYTHVEFEGDIRALADIETLADANYGEDTMGKGVPLPKELKYLR